MNSFYDQSIFEVKYFSSFQSPWFIIISGLFALIFFQIANGSWQNILCDWTWMEKVPLKGGFGRAIELINCEQKPIKGGCIFKKAKKIFTCFGTCLKSINLRISKLKYDTEYFLRLK